MSGHVGALLVLNVGYVVAGTGIALLLGAVTSGRELVVRIGLAYVLGVAGVGMVAAHLALIGEFPGRVGVAVLASLLLAGGVVRWRAWPAPARAHDRDALPFARPTLLVSAGALIATAVQLIDDARAFRVDALRDWDAWNIWVLKGRVLQLTGDAGAPALTSPAYVLSHLDYPLLLPSLNGLALRAAGGLDVSVLKLQLLLLLAGFAAAAVGLLSGRTPSEATAVAVLALTASPWLIDELRSGYADVPVALFTALGVAALARWLVEGERWALAVASFLLAAAALTKNEGLWFSSAAYAGALGVLLVSRRQRVGALLAGALGTLVAVAPWRVWVVARDLPSNDYRLSDVVHPGVLADRWPRVDPAVHDLWHQIGLNTWGSAKTLLVLGLAAGLLARRVALAVFVVAWLALAFSGLVLVYWISPLEINFYLAVSSNRVVTTLIVAGAVLGALLTGEAWRAARSDAPMDAAEGAWRLP